jgi:hypothetical protein
MAEIKKIVLKIGDKEISLSPQEAKELKSVLNELFGDPITVREVHHLDWKLPYIPASPYFGPMWQVGLNDNVVTCSTTDYSDDFKIA